MKARFPLYGAAAGVPIRIAPVKVMSPQEIEEEMAKEPAHMDKPVMELSEYYKLKSRERREKYYAQGLNAKGEPSRRLAGSPVGTNNSMWRDAIAKARAGDPDAITCVIDELARRMDTAKRAYAKRREKHYANGLTAFGGERKKK